MFFVFDSILNRYKAQAMCDRVVSEDAFLIVYCPNKYITQKMRDKAVDDSLAALKLIPDQFFKSNMINKFFPALYVDENILYFNEDSDVVFHCYEMDFLTIDVNNINLDNNFDEDNPDTIIFVRFLAWDIKIE